MQSRLGGGLAGHNGLKSLERGLGSREFWRVRVGVGRPDSTDPEIVSAYVLGRFREPRDEVETLIGAAADETERLVERLDGRVRISAPTDDAPGTALVRHPRSSRVALLRAAATCTAQLGQSRPRGHVNSDSTV